jgi:hypothetical protein
LLPTHLMRAGESTITNAVGNLECFRRKSRFHTRSRRGLLFFNVDLASLTNRVIDFDM